MKPKRIPTAELEVLGALSHRGRATARELRESLYETRPMSHGSMLTLLKRLEARGLLEKEKAPIGRAFYFKPSADHRNTFLEHLDHLKSKVFQSDNVQLVAGLFETQLPTLEELSELHRLLNDLEAKVKEKEGDSR